MNPFVFTFCSYAVNLQQNCLFRSSNKISKPMNQKGKVELECTLHILSMEFEIHMLLKGSIEAGFPRAVVLFFCGCVTERNASQLWLERYIYHRFMYDLTLLPQFFQDKWVYMTFPLSGSMSCLVSLYLKIFGSCTLLPSCTLM